MGDEQLTIYSEGNRDGRELSMLGGWVGYESSRIFLKPVKPQEDGYPKKEGGLGKEDLLS
jgi:hypothetical protein